MFTLVFGNEILCYKRKEKIFVPISWYNLHKKSSKNVIIISKNKKCSIFTHFFRTVSCSIQYTFEVFSYLVVAEMIKPGLCGTPCW